MASGRSDQTDEDNSQDRPVGVQLSERTEGLVDIMVNSTCLTIYLEEDRKSLTIHFIWPIGFYNLGEWLGPDPVCAHMDSVDDLHVRVRSWPPEDDRNEAIARIDQGENAKLIDEFIAMAFRRFVTDGKVSPPVSEWFLDQLKIMSNHMRDIWIQCLEAVAPAPSPN